MATKKKAKKQNSKVKKTTAKAKKTVKKTLKSSKKKSSGRKPAQKATKVKTAQKSASPAKSKAGSAAKKSVSTESEAIVTGQKVGLDIELGSTDQASTSLKQYSGQRVVLYFYPKDNTPGCTTEGLDFRRLHADFKALNTVILGVSRDSVKSHLKFQSQCEFPFQLLADESEALCKAFDVIREKSLYGKKYLGVDRSTFVLDTDGTVLKEWRAVKVPGHAEAVLEFVRSL